jgi:hypothetical protein
MTVNLTELLAGVTDAAADAAYIAGRVEFYVSTIDDAALTGAQKLDAVKQALDADLTTWNPEFAAKFDQLWTVLAPAVSGLVTLWRITGVLAAAAKGAEALIAAV